ncbi:amidohydrolase [Synergistaceae bacterium OttesenSCG-928-D05]|nr:amidohydrolase [Synergistaceae bacterium OttesenSCG-928-D05]
MGAAGDKIKKEMTERRRDLHRHPETGWTEFRTTAKVAEILRALGYTVHFGSAFIKPEHVMGRNIDVDAEKKRAVEQGADPKIVTEIGDYTGLYAELDTGKPGPVTVLRFDIDCVDANESMDENHLPVKLGFTSVNPGWMHACAHDGHTAIGLALAELLKEDQALKGKIRLLFQPAEEGVRGGYAMMAAGLVDDADYFIAMHLGLGKPTGEVYGGVDGFLCTTKLDVDFKGFGAHAGGEPQKGRNALLAAASAALNLHAIAPNAEGATRLNVGVLNAGEGRNVIAPNAHMKIETRGETDELAAYVYNRAEQIIEGAAKMYDVSFTITKQGEANRADSSPKLAALVSEAAKTVEGVTCVGTKRPMAGSDDACWLMKRVQERGGQATYIGIGADTAAGHHNGRFDFDETAMPIALDVLYGTVKQLNG